MYELRRILQEEVKRSSGKMQIEKVPEEKQPMGKTVARIEREIKAQIDANIAMRERSYTNASEEV